LREREIVVGKQTLVAALTQTLADEEREAAHLVVQATES